MDLFLMGRSDYHTVLSIYYYIVTGYEPIGFGPLPDQKPIAKILRGGWGASNVWRLTVKTMVPPARTFHPRSKRPTRLACLRTKTKMIYEGDDRGWNA